MNSRTHAQPALNRVAANRQRIEEARQREEREAAAIRALATPVPARFSDKVQSLDVAYSARGSSGKKEQKE
jgi:hypothetical protein